MGNISDDEIKQQLAQAIRKERYRSALTQFISEQPGDQFVTLTFNTGALPLSKMRFHLSRYLGLLDRFFIHDRFYKLPRDRRTTGVFFAEKLDCNAHWHGVIRFPPARHRNPLVLGLTVKDAAKHWKKIARKGDALFLPIADAKEKVVAYASKEFWKHDFQDQLAFAAEFHPSR